MTATEVDGRAVVTDEPARSPLGVDRGGNPVYFKQTRELTLDDGSVVYGCLHCEFIDERSAAIRPHLRVHASDRTNTRTGGKKTIELLAAELVKAEADRDQWKARARKAERDLATIRRAIGGK